MKLVVQFSLLATTFGFKGETILNSTKTGIRVGRSSVAGSPNVIVPVMNSVVR